MLDPVNQLVHFSAQFDKIHKQRVSMGINVVIPADEEYPDAATPGADPGPDINEILKTIEKQIFPMIIAKSHDGYLHDYSTVSIICEKAHLHPYYVQEVIKGRPQCITCSTRNKCENLIRESAEDFFKIPFVKQQTSQETATYVNLEKKILLEYHKHKYTGGNITQDNDFMRIHFGKTTSKAVIISRLKEARGDYIVPAKFTPGKLPIGPTLCIENFLFGKF